VLKKARNEKICPLPVNGEDKNGLRFFGSRLRLEEIAQTAKTGMIWMAEHDVVENFDFEKLTSSNEVTGDFYIGFRWSRIARYAVCGISGVIPHPVLCRTVQNLPCFGLGQQLPHAA
jgi:hypothetical protein